MDTAVSKYISSVKDERRKLYDRLEKLIYSAYPAAQASISYTLVRYATGKGGVWLGYWKEGVSVHALDAAAYRRAHPEVKVGRGSVNFRIRDKIDTALLKRLIKRAMERKA